jgi:hypothetical protein
MQFYGIFSKLCVGYPRKRIAFVLKPEKLELVKTEKVLFCIKASKTA